MLPARWLPRRCEAMRINYFDDAALIQEQAERFAQK